MAVEVEVVYKEVVQRAISCVGNEGGLTKKSQQVWRAFVKNEDWSRSDYGINDVSCMNCITILCLPCTRLLLRHQTCSILSYLRWLPKDLHATNLAGVDDSQIA